MTRVRNLMVILFHADVVVEPPGRAPNSARIMIPGADSVRSFDDAQNFKFRDKGRMGA